MIKSILDRVKGVRFIKIKGKEYDLFEEIGIHDDLNVVFKEHPERALFWRRILNSEQAKLSRLEEELESVKGTMFQNYWRAHEEEVRQFSDTLIWSFVHDDEEVQEKRKEVRVQRKRVNELKSVCDAFEHRRSALMQLGAMYRRESETLSTRRNTHGKG